MVLQHVLHQMTVHLVVFHQQQHPQAPGQAGACECAEAPVVRDTSRASRAEASVKVRARASVMPSSKALLGNKRPQLLDEAATDDKPQPIAPKLTHRVGRDLHEPLKNGLPSVGRKTQPRISHAEGHGKDPGGTGQYLGTQPTVPRSVNLRTLPSRFSNTGRDWQAGRQNQDAANPNNYIISKFLRRILRGGPARHASLSPSCP